MLKLQTLQWKQLSNRSSLWAKNTTVFFSTTEMQNIKFLYLSFQFVFVKISYISWSWTLMKIFLSEKLSLLSFSNSSVYLPYLNKKLTCYKMIVVKTWLLIVIDGGHMSVFDIRFFFLPFVKRYRQLMNKNHFVLNKYIIDFRLYSMHKQWFAVSLICVT